MNVPFYCFSVLNYKTALNALNAHSKKESRFLKTHNKDGKPVFIMLACKCWFVMLAVYLFMVSIRAH